ncbi:hypothetical protein Pcinc_022931 [Petrolisthes cinctipes]|uniref:Uncharacterized protein n=1 Tax=Petrolisthes cinctipes TaxID=88211 RepID=A0AAE1FFC5_PETCI|nr:hypothetical protein Pcinc_022931 [Petrolisthes cinctipes]
MGKKDLSQLKKSKQSFSLPPRHSSTTTSHATPRPQSAPLLSTKGPSSLSVVVDEPPRTPGFDQGQQDVPTHQDPDDEVEEEDPPPPTTEEDEVVDDDETDGGGGIQPNHPVQEELVWWLHTKRTRYGRILTKLEKSGSVRTRLTDLEQWIYQLFSFMEKHIQRQRPTKTLGLPQSAATAGRPPPPPPREPLPGTSDKDKDDLARQPPATEEHQVRRGPKRRRVAAAPGDAGDKSSFDKGAPDAITYAIGTLKKGQWASVQRLTLQQQGHQPSQLPLQNASTSPYPGFADVSLTNLLNSLLHLPPQDRDQL